MQRLDVNRRTTSSEAQVSRVRREFMIYLNLRCLIRLKTFNPLNQN